MNKIKHHKTSYIGLKFFITAVAFASTLGLWNLFSKESSFVSDILTNSVSSSTTSQTTNNTQTSSQASSFTQLFLGGSAPSAQNQAGVPQPITQTNSSK